MEQEELLQKYNIEGTYSQAAIRCVCALVNTWYGDRDIYDNTHFHKGWYSNDLSWAANWLYEYLPELRPFLLNIHKFKKDKEYEELLEFIKSVVFSEAILKSLSQDKYDGDLYNTTGPFRVVDVED